MSKGFYAKLNDLLNLLAPIIESIEPIEDQAMLWYQTIQHLRGVTSIQTTQTYESVWLTIKVMLDARLSSRAFGQQSHTNNTLAPSPANPMVPSHTNPMVPSPANPMVPSPLSDSNDFDRDMQIQNIDTIPEAEPYVDYITFSNYVASKGYNIDVQALYTKYANKGWRDASGLPIASWQKLVDKIATNSATKNIIENEENRCNNRIGQYNSDPNRLSKILNSI